MFKDITIQQSTEMRAYIPLKANFPHKCTIELGFWNTSSPLFKIFPHFGALLFQKEKPYGSNHAHFV